MPDQQTVKPERPLPPGTALSIEVLPAAHGDCLVVRAPMVGGEYRMIVDAGPDDASYNTLANRLRSIPLAPDRRQVDLFVMTHIDHDHIGNAARLLKDESLDLRFGDIWFNGRQQVNRSRREADAISAVIEDHRLPLNRAFAGGPVVVEDGLWRLIPTPQDAPRLTLLSPNVAALAALAQGWDDAACRLADAQPDAGPDVLERGVRPDRPPIDLVSLAATAFRSDRSVPNRSSIVLLVEHRGASILLAADGNSKIYGPALAALLTRRPEDERRVDAIKLAHHGSRANTEARLAFVGAEHYLISSNNAIYGLPDDETLARLIVGALPGTAPTFWFNCATPLNVRWQNVHDPDHHFTVRYPAQAADGVVLDLPERAH